MHTAELGELVRNQSSVGVVAIDGDRAKFGVRFRGSATTNSESDNAASQHQKHNAEKSLHGRELYAIFATLWETGDRLDPEF